jgi:hypothetical protein
MFWRELQGPSDGVEAGKDISQIIANFGYDEIWLLCFGSGAVA